MDITREELESIITAAVEKATKGMSEKIDNIESALLTKTKVIKDGKLVIKKSINL